MGNKRMTTSSATPAEDPATTTSMAKLPGNHRTVLITGVSKGLGKALALELAKRGHTVIGCSRSQDKLNALQAELVSLSANSPSPAASVQNRHLVLNVDVVRSIFTPLNSFECSF